jgi:2,3-bisphosphoglycerate-dependent phosphoglycerate mutase
MWNMYKVFIIIIATILVSCNQQTYYVVRHAEKETQVMTGDPPLSATGILQSKDLLEQLRNQKISHIYSTNYKRTLSTAEPLSQALGIGIEQYDAVNTKAIVERIKTIRDGNILIVGHSNTVDDIVNALMNQKLMSDLPDSEYGYLYVVTKKGNKFTFRKLAYTNKGTK